MTVLVLLPALALTPARSAEGREMTVISHAPIPFASQALAEPTLSSISGHHASFLRYLKQVFPGVAFLSIFGGAATFAYLHWPSAPHASPLTEYKSFMWLSGFGGLSGGLWAQWLRLRHGKADHWHPGSIFWLIVLNLTYSPFVEKVIYGGWLEHVPGIGFLPAGVVQLLLDLVFISLFYSDPAAFLVYGKFLDPRKEAYARNEISHKLLGFYLIYGLIWGFWLALALAFQSNPVCSFIFVQAGVLSWNVAFEYDDETTTEGIMEKIRRRRITAWMIPMFNGIQAIYAHCWYVTALKTAGLATWSYGFSDFLSQLGTPTPLIHAAGMSLLLLWLTTVLYTKRRWLIRRVAWLLPLAAAAALALGPQDISTIRLQSAV